MKRALFVPLLAAACAAPPAEPPTPTPDVCEYPAGAAEPMAVGQVLSPYKWPESLDVARNNVPLDLTRAPCADDENIDWSPFDHLLFVSVPAW
jgi:hypothetical protein